MMPNVTIPFVNFAGPKDVPALSVTPNRSFVGAGRSHQGISNGLIQIKSLVFLIVNFTYEETFDLFYK